MDLVMRGATVYDGSGSPPQIADVGLSGERIEAIGDLAHERGTVEVDASGLALAPGFIDVHSHDDFAVFLTPDMDFKVAQGVTTDIVGNCGLGAAPFRPARMYLTFFGAEERADALPAWDSYADYLDAVDANPPSLNVGVLVGHGTIRLDAMGNERRTPTDAELAAMVETLSAALDAGCVGYSSGLIYEPGRYSRTEELVALARAMAAHRGVYSTHMRNEGDRLLDAVREAIRVGEEGGVAVQISHHKASTRTAWGRVKDSLALIEAARDRGVDVTADQYPYTAGSTSLHAVLQNYEEGTSGIGATDWSSVVLVSAPQHAAWEGKPLDALAAEFDETPHDTARRVVDAEGFGAVVVMHSMCEEDVRTVMAHPTTMIGSDGIPTLGGKPHPRLYGTFARVLGHYARDEAVLPLAEAVHRMTGLPAAKFGLTDRGTLVPGAWADLVLFDPATIDDIATYDSPRQYPAGIRGVWVNGTAVVRDGTHTGARPGRPVRHVRGAST
jgi:N-acyl-D-amino-acid deacylase